MKTVVLIPARGGSKSIPEKNITDFCGKILIHYAIQASWESSANEVWISTESKVIKDIILDMEKEDVNVIDRPKELATDEAATESVMFHFAREVEFDIIVLVQCTSPMICAKDIDKAIGMVASGQYDSVFSGTRMKQFIWKGSEHMTPVTLDIFNRPRKQELYEGQYHVKETGAFYVITRKEMFHSKNRLGGRIGCVEVPFWTSFEIDTPKDLEVMQKIMETF
jgi:CMP-N-acetylneuraminic acid synthetase